MRHKSNTTRDQPKIENTPDKAIIDGITMFADTFGTKNKNGKNNFIHFTTFPFNIKDINKNLPLILNKYLLYLPKITLKIIFFYLYL